MTRLALALALLGTGCFTRPELRDDEGNNTGANIAFVTSMTRAPSSFGGVEAVDAWCQELADNAELGGTYISWTSGPTSDAIDRLQLNGVVPRGWIRPDGRAVADTAGDLANGIMFAPMNMTEAKLTLDGGERAATGTLRSGFASPATCNGFSSTMGNVESGFPDGAGRAWTDWSADFTCTDPLHVYCLGVGSVQPVEVAKPATYRSAFLSKGTVIAGSGALAFDTTCMNEAVAAELSGTYRAAVPTATQSVQDRFSAGDPWIRRDNTLVFDGMLTTMLAPLDVTAGTFVDAMVLGSTQESGTPAPTTSCNGWTEQMETEQFEYGWSLRSAVVDAFSSYGSYPCSAGNLLHVYCLED